MQQLNPSESVKSSKNASKISCDFTEAQNEGTRRLYPTLSFVSMVLPTLCTVR